MKYKPLHAFLGDPVLLIAPADVSTDGISASDNVGGVPIIGASGVEFLQIVGVSDSNMAMQIQIQYSSTGNASDAVTSNAGMTCTDAVFVAMSTDSGSAIFILDFDLAAKGLSDGVGKLFASVAAAENGASVFSLIGRPYGGTQRWPATNAQTVVRASA